MTSKATRRLFLAGAALSAPIVAATAATAGTRGEEGDGLRARLATLEDLAAIREINDGYVRAVNARARHAAARLFEDPARAVLDPGITSLAADPLGEPDAIEIAADRATAVARVACVAQTETAITPSCPLVEMAREQGEGVVRRAERRVLEIAFVRDDGVWKIAQAHLRPG